VDHRGDCSTNLESLAYQGNNWSKICEFLSFWTNVEKFLDSLDTGAVIAEVLHDSGAPLDSGLLTGLQRTWRLLCVCPIAFRGTQDRSRSIRTGSMRCSCHDVGDTRAVGATMCWHDAAHFARLHDGSPWVATENSERGYWRNWRCSSDALLRRHCC
jgi:hypothetical protein